MRRWFANLTRGREKDGRGADVPSENTKTQEETRGAPPGGPWQAGWRDERGAGVARRRSRGGEWRGTNSCCLSRDHKMLGLLYWYENRFGLHLRKSCRIWEPLGPPRFFWTLFRTPTCCEVSAPNPDLFKSGFGKPRFGALQSASGHSAPWRAARRGHAAHK